ARPRGFARQYPFLEDAHRGTRRRADVRGRLALRAVRLWQVVLAEGGTATSFGGGPRAAGVRRGRGGADGSAPAARPGESQSVRAGRGRVDGGAGGLAARARTAAGQEGAARPRSIRAMAARPEGRRTERAGVRPAAVRRRARAVPGAGAR